MSERIARRFESLRRQGRGGLVTFITAGDPDIETSEALLARLPDTGADIVELGMAFTDPMADGPAIQKASRRALAAGITVEKTLDMAARFRARDDDTPLVLMGYFNPVLAFGVERFVRHAADAGVDGLIVVDLPPEEDAELREPAKKAGLDVIRLATPTTDDARLPKVLNGASGFLYYVAVAGVTGSKSAMGDEVRSAVSRIRQKSELPVAVGFGIRTPAQAGEIAQGADAAVVGSAIVGEIAARLDDCGRAKPGLVDEVADFVQNLAEGVRAVGRMSATK